MQPEEIETTRRLLPEFPRTSHLPLDPHAQRDDLVASSAELHQLLRCDTLYVEEKVHGAQVRLTLHEGQVVLGNRSKILSKGYIGRGTAAKAQFAPLWTWMYDHLDRFYALEAHLGFMPGVYGEWLYADHGIAYDRLPEWFVAYDLWDPDKQTFLETGVTRNVLTDVGFVIVPLIASGRFTPEQLLALRDGPSAFGSGAIVREGIYLKGSQAGASVARYKMVSPGFSTDPDWNKKPLRRIPLWKGERGC